MGDDHWPGRAAVSSVRPTSKYDSEARQGCDTTARLIRRSDRPRRKGYSGPLRGLLRGTTPGDYCGGLLRDLDPPDLGCRHRWRRGAGPIGELLCERDAAYEQPQPVRERAAAVVAGDLGAVPPEQLLAHRLQHPVDELLVGVLPRHHAAQ